MKEIQEFLYLIQNITISHFLFNEYYNRYKIVLLHAIKLIWCSGSSFEIDRKRRLEKIINHFLHDKMGLFGRFKLLIAALYQLNEKVSSYPFMLLSKILRVNYEVTFLRNGIDGKCE